jgi:hypothetical protein
VNSIRHRDTMREFLNSPEAQQPLVKQDYHDQVLPGASSTRERQERKERLERLDVPEGSNGRQGMVSEGGSIAGPQTSARFLTESSAPVDARAQAKANQAETRKLLAEMSVTALELEMLASIMKSNPRIRIPSEWKNQLGRLRRIRRGVAL